VFAMLLAGTLLSSQCSLPPYASEYRFSDFAAAVQVITQPATPKLTTPEARLYRTQIRRAAKNPPDFSGHLRVAVWGCGTCCGDFAIIDLLSGYVWPSPFGVTCGPDESRFGGQVGLYYCPESKLFVVIGSKNDSEVAGAYYYLWDGKGLRLLKAVEDRNSATP